MLKDPQVLRAVAEQLAAEHGDAAIAVGQHALQGRLSLAFRGSIEQLPPQTFVQAPRVPLDLVLALVSERAGIKAERLAELIVAAAVEACTAGVPASEFLECTKRSIRQAQDRLKAELPASTRNGPLRRILTIDQVEIEGASLSQKARRKRPA